MRTKTEVWSMEPEPMNEPESAKPEQVASWYKRLASSQDQELREYLRSLI